MTIRATLIAPVFDAAGGAEQWMMDLMAATGPEIAWGPVVTWRAPEGERPVEIRSGSEAIHQALRESDVVVGWGLRLPWRRGYRSRCVVVAHGDLNSAYTRGVIQQNPHAHRLVVVSPTAWETIPESLHPRTSLILNAVDVARLKGAPGLRDALRVKDTTRLLGFIGRMTWEKNARAVIDTLEHLPEDWHAVFVGTGRQRAALQHAAAPMNGRVHFVGVRHDIGALLRSFDFLMVPSLQEGFGYVIAEGWAAGCPVLSTRVGVATMFPQAIRALPFPLESLPTDTPTEPLPSVGEAYAAIVAEEYARPVHWRRRVEMGHRAVATELSLKRFGEQWTALLREVVASP